MNPSHYPKLELCKKLTELYFPNKKSYLVLNSDEQETVNEWFEWLTVYPSVSELLDEMPEEIETIIPVFLSIEKRVDKYIVSYSDNGIEKWNKYFFWDSLGDALAEMWIWLKENNYL